MSYSQDDMKKLKEVFIKAIKVKKKVKLRFFSKKDSAVVIRKCAPMDFGPSRRFHDNIDRFHLWDYEGEGGPHTMSIDPRNIISLEVLEESFEPKEFVKWPPNWLVERDWGDFS